MYGKLKNLFDWLDNPSPDKKKKFINQFFPVITCLILFVLFIAASHFFIVNIINPLSAQKIEIHLGLIDILVGFFLYFVTAVDYALIIGRMSIQNPDSRSRLTMNIFTCLGCFVGVTLVLFLWGLAKEVSWFILILLIFAGSVMLKLAYEGREYFEDSNTIPGPIRTITVFVLKTLYYPTRIFTYWIPELGNPGVGKMSLSKLARWGFLLPFIIGLDDFVGYMGAMTIYNAFGLIFGIYIADIAIDIMIFVSPKLTKKMVENAFISFAAVFAFLFLAYKSFSESWILAEEKFHLSNLDILAGFVGFIIIMIFCDLIIKASRQKASSN